MGIFPLWDILNTKPQEYRFTFSCSPCFSDSQTSTILEEELTKYYVVKNWELALTYTMVSYHLQIEPSNFTVWRFLRIHPSNHLSKLCNHPTNSYWVFTVQKALCWALGIQSWDFVFWVVYGVWGHQQVHWSTTWEGSRDVYTHSLGFMSKYSLEGRDQVHFLVTIWAWSIHSAHPANSD